MPYCSNCGALVYDTAKHCYRCESALAAFGEPNESAAIKLPLDPNARRLTRAQRIYEQADRPEAPLKLKEIWAIGHSVVVAAKRRALQSLRRPPERSRRAAPSSLCHRLCKVALERRSAHPPKPACAFAAWRKGIVVCKATSNATDVYLHLEQREGTSFAVGANKRTLNRAHLPGLRQDAGISATESCCRVKSSQRDRLTVLDHIKVAGAFYRPVEGRIEAARKIFVRTARVMTAKVIGTQALPHDILAHSHAVDRIGNVTRVDGLRRPGHRPHLGYSDVRRIERHRPKPRTGSR